MAILFIQNWDIIHGREDDYKTFINDRYLSEIAEIGLIAVGGYYVEVGFGPRIIVVFSAEGHEVLSSRLADKRFKNLVIDLKSIIYNYRASVLEPTGAVKRRGYTIQKGVWKFNQYYDIRPGMKKVYADFIINEHLPTMQKIDYVEVTGGWNVVLGGVSEIIAEFTFKDPVDIGRLIINEDFRRITHKLKNDLVTNYMSRILRTTERFDEPRWFRL
ncbi:MAG: hypothetical protein KBE27_00915 [Syntrophorhabdaceae bacterium]|nr:hypothetical protein [Syntrophorhabdales bacterium]MBP9560363.1 hypothetical protein [Syntrophorhabdaceae bacterium]